jgi:hypothetical protein
MRVHNARKKRAEKSQTIKRVFDRKKKVLKKNGVSERKRREKTTNNKTHHRLKRTRTHTY